MRSMKHLTIAAFAAMAVALAGCGGGSSPTPPAMVEPTSYEMAKANIAAAETAEAAQAAYDAVKDDVTAAQGDMLQDLVDERVAALATMARAAMQRQELMDAADAIDTSDLSTQALVDAARAAIADLRQAIDDADDVDDTSMYQTQLNNAVDAVDMAQDGINTDTRRMNQMTALSDASGDLQDALAALSGATPTQALLDDANNASTALNDALAAAMDLTETEKAPYQREADNAAGPIQMAQMAFDEDEDEAAKAAAAAMAVTASKLYAGIGAPDATAGNAAQRQAAYSGTDDVDITVTWGAADTVQALTVDEDATVAAHHGWTGMMFTAEPDDAGTYEAVVYSHVGEPTEGAKFNDAANGGYTLNADDQIENVTTVTDYAGLVDSPSFDQSAGTKTFDLAENREYLELIGTFNGVSGTYTCTPTAIATDRDTCGATVAASGFTLIGGTWMFEPDDPEARLMNVPDTNYASYGWWLHKSEDGNTYVASAFHDYRGTDAGAVTDIAALRGTATYTGGAAGKYSLRGDTGGTNDAGHFTANAMLEATFAAAHSISGTISNFIGADGEMRDWTVALGASVVSGAGAIAGDPDDTNDTGPQMTTWTIGGTASDAAGSWSGTLREEGDDGVPAIVTGTFHSTYGQDGNDGVMVGGFGANVQ